MSMFNLRIYWDTISKIKANFKKNGAVVTLGVQLITATLPGCVGNVIQIGSTTPTSTTITQISESNKPSILDFSSTDVPTLYKGEQPSFEQINNELKPYGKFIVAKPMPANTYKKAMDNKWIKVIPTGIKKDLSIDLTKSYSYKELENFILNLAEYDGVDVYIIGKTVQGRNLYSININLKSPTINELTNSGMKFEDALIFSVKRAVIKGTLNNDYICDKYKVDNIDKLTTEQLTNLVKEIQLIEQNENSRPTVILTGQVHANEFAGSVVILKQFGELLNDNSKRLLYENVTLVAVPVVNPDGREINRINGTVNKKSNANGVDINRNFPSVGASQLFNGKSRPAALTTGPSPAFYPGPTLGSEPETQALIKWFYVNLKNTNNKNTYYFDYHQQGRGIYVGKPWDHQDSQMKTVQLGQDVMNYLNQGNTNGYKRIFNLTSYSVDGTGGATIDQVMSDAKGMIFSNYWGVLALNTGDINDASNKGQPAVMFNTITKENEKYYKPLNTNFQGGTIELTKSGEGKGSPLGDTQTARNLIAQEYNKYHFNGLLEFMSERLLGNEKVKNIELQGEEITKLKKSFITKTDTSNIDIAINELRELREEFLDSNVFENARKSIPTNDKDKLEDEVLSALRRAI